MVAAYEAQRRAIEAGMSPDQVADCVFQAIRRTGVLDFTCRRRL
jgi:hypothetical protein